MLPGMSSRFRTQPGVEDYLSQFKASTATADQQSSEATGERAQAAFDTSAIDKQRQQQQAAADAQAKAAKRQADAQRRAALAQEDAQQDLRSNQIEQRRLTIEPDYRAASDTYAKAKAAKDKFANDQIEQQGTFWVRKDAKTGGITPLSAEEAQARKDARRDAENAFAEVDKQFQPVNQQWEAIQATRRKLEFDRLKIAERRLKEKAGLTDDPQQQDPTAPVTPETLPAPTNATESRMRFYADQQQARMNTYADQQGRRRTVSPLTANLIRIEMQKRAIEARAKLGDIAPEEAQAKIEAATQRQTALTEQAKEQARTSLAAKLQGQDPAKALEEVRDNKGREIAAQFIGTGTAAQNVAGQEAGGAAKAKEAATGIGNLAFGNQTDRVAELLKRSGGDIDKAIALAGSLTQGKAQAANTMTSTPTGFGGPSGGAGFAAGIASSADQRQTKDIEAAKKSLEAMKQQMDAAGVAPERRKTIIEDAAKATAWTEKDTDRVRVLSTDQIVLNPGQVFGDRAGVEAEIRKTAKTPEIAADAIQRLDAMRNEMARQMFADNMMASKDSILYAGFEKFAAERIPNYKADGVTDEQFVKVVDEWSKTQKDRNWVYKTGNTLASGIKQGQQGIGKTILGTAASGAALTDALTGVGGETAGTLGLAQQSLNQRSQYEESSATQQGLTGGYGLTRELTTTLGQMAPMFAGGIAAQGLKGAAQVAMRGLAVYGWAGAQGWESMGQIAIDEATQVKGSRLTGDEIVATLQDPKIVAAQLANAAQTMALAYMRPKGTERVATGAKGAIPDAMTVRQFLGRGGLRVLRDGSFRKEFGKMAKNVFADAKDEAIEESLNQMIETLIAAAGTGKEIQLGEAVQEWAKAGLLGGLIGGGVNQIARGTTPEQRHQQQLASIAQRIQQDAVDPDLVADAIAEIDPTERIPTAQELKEARQLVAPDQDAFRNHQKQAEAYKQAVAAKDWKGARAIDEAMQAAFPDTETNTVRDTADAVLLVRELGEQDVVTKDAFDAAQAAFNEAMVSGDREAKAAAGPELAAARSARQAHLQTRAAVKIASGMDVSSITDEEAWAMGWVADKKNPGFIIPMEAKQLADVGLQRPLMKEAKDGSLILTDDAVATVRATSERAGRRVKLSEQEAAELAQKRFDEAEKAKKAKTPKTNEQDPQGTPGQQAPAQTPQPAPADPNPPGGVVRDGTEQPAAASPDGAGPANTPPVQEVVEEDPFEPTAEDEAALLAELEAEMAGDAEPVATDSATPKKQKTIIPNELLPDVQKITKAALDAGITHDQIIGLMDFFARQNRGDVISTEDSLKYGGFGGLRSKVSMAIESAFEKTMETSRLRNALNEIQAQVSFEAEAATATTAPATSTQPEPEVPDIAAQLAAVDIEQQGAESTRAATTPQEQSQARSIANKVAAAVIKAAPKLKGRVSVKDSPENESNGGVMVRFDGTMQISPIDIASEIKKNGWDEATAIRVLTDTAVAHEVGHIAQIGVARRKWLEAGSKGSFGDFFLKLNADLFNEMVAQNPEIEKAAAVAYGIEEWKRIGKEGTPEQARGRQGAEALRMFLETTMRGQTSELTREMARDQQGTGFAKWLREIIDHLKKILDTLPDQAKAHLAELEAFYKELTLSPASTSDTATTLEAQPDLRSEIADYIARKGEDPPLKDGFVRLYRGEDSEAGARSTGENVGKFWSKYSSEAATYGDRLFYLDVPASKLGDMTENSIVLAPKGISEIGAKLLDPGYFDMTPELADAIEQQKWGQAAKLHGMPDAGESTPKKKPRQFSFADNRVMVLFTSNPFVNEIIQQGGMMSASRAKKEMGAAWWAENGSQYDDAPTFSNPSFNRIYSKSSSLTPNQLAEAIARAGLMPTGDVNAMWKEVAKAATSTTNQNKQIGQEIEKQKDAEQQAGEQEGELAPTSLEEKQNDRFNAANKPDDESIGMEPADFTPDMIGGTVTVDGEPMVIDDVKINSLGIATQITLNDHTRFGRQTLEDGEVVFVEEEAPEAMEEAPEINDSPDVGETDFVNTDDQFQNPELLTPDQWVAKIEARRGGTTILSRESSQFKQGRLGQASSIAEAYKANLPVNAIAAEHYAKASEGYRTKIPASYVKQGDTYVFRGKAKAPTPVEEAPTPVEEAAPPAPLPRPSSPMTQQAAAIREDRSIFDDWKEGPQPNGWVNRQMPDGNWVSKKKGVRFTIRTDETLSGRMGANGLIWQNHVINPSGGLNEKLTGAKDLVSLQKRLDDMENWIRRKDGKPELGAPPAPEVNERIFSDEYTGPRFTYGFRNRPLGIGTAPKGFIIGSDGPAVGRARHGTIQYPRQLTEKEIYDFELEVMPNEAPPTPSRVGETITFNHPAVGQATGTIQDMLADGNFGVKTDRGVRVKVRPDQVVETPATDNQSLTVQTQPTLAQLNDPAWHAQRVIDEINQWVATFTNNGQRKISDVFGPSEETRRVKMFLDRGDRIRGYATNTKAVGPEATFRININKARTFAEVRTAAEKLLSKLAAAAATEESTAVQKPAQEIGTIPAHVARAITQNEQARIIGDLNAELHGEGAREWDFGKPENPALVEQAKALAKENGWKWSDVVEQSRNQLGLNEDFGKPGSDEQKRLDTLRQSKARLDEKFGEKPAKKPAPASAMDKKNTNAKELFQDDGGFKLGQETTTDGAKIEAARKAKEEAKAAADAAQGDMFADEAPQLTPEEQALKDDLEGLFASRSRDTGTLDLFAPENLAKPSMKEVKTPSNKSALGAYRALTAKKQAGKTLKPEEEQDLLEAETALGQKMAFDMAPEKLKGKDTDLLQAAIVEATMPQAARSMRAVQQSMFMGEEGRGGQQSLFASSSPGMPTPPPRSAFERTAKRLEALGRTKRTVRQEEAFDRFFAEEEARDDAYDKKLSEWVDSIPENKPISFIRRREDNGLPNYYTVTKNASDPARPWRTTYFNTQIRPDWTAEEEIEYEDLFKKTRWYSNSPEWSKWNDRLYELGSRPNTTQTRIVPSGHEEAKTRMEAVKHAMSMAGNREPEIGALFSSASNNRPTIVVKAEIPQGFPATEEGVKPMVKWAKENVKGSWPSQALDADVEVTSYGINHTAAQLARNPKRMRVIAALPSLIRIARIVTPQTGKNIQMHALVELDGKIQLARITVEERTGDSRGPWNRFYDIKGVEIKNALDAMSAFPSVTEGSLLAIPGREVTLDQLSRIVKEAEGGETLFSSASTLNLLASEPLPLDRMSIAEAVESHVKRIAPGWTGGMRGPRPNDPETMLGLYDHKRKEIRINHDRFQFIREKTNLTDADLDQAIKTTLTHELIHAAEDDVLRDIYREEYVKGKTPNFDEWRASYRDDLWNAMSSDAGVRKAAAAYIGKMPKKMRPAMMQNRFWIMPEITRMFIEQQVLGRTSEEFAGITQKSLRAENAWMRFIARTMDKLRAWLGQDPPAEVSRLITATKKRLESYGAKPDEQMALFSSASASPESRRHAQLEAKHNAGTITAAETKEAERIVEARAKKAGWTGDVMYHTTGANEPFTEFKYAALTGGEDRYRVGGNKAAMTFTLEGLSSGWFTSNGSQFSGWRNSNASNVVRAYVNLKKPLTIEADPFAQREYIENKKELADIRATIKAVQNQETFIPQAEFKRIREREKELAREVDFSRFDEDQVIKLSEQLNETYTNKGIKELEKKIKSLTERTGSREEILKRRRELTYADPFYGLMSLSETAQQEYPDLIPGAAVRAGMKAQGYDGIILQGTNADTAMGDTTLATWVIPFDGGSTIKSAAPFTGVPLDQRFDASNPSILFSSASPNDQSPYSAPIPPAVIAKMWGSLSALVESGQVTTPETLAATLKKFGPGAPKLSQGLWSIISAVKGEAPTAPDWAGIYGETKQTPADGQQVQNGEGAGDVVAGDGEGGVAVGEDAAKESLTTETKDDFKLTPPPEKKGIQDFGEKIFGARKDLWGKFKKAIGQELPPDAADLTISKSFPEPDYEMAIENGIPTDSLATYKAIRDSIPPKPRQSYKLSRWATMVRGIHPFMQQLANGEAMTGAQVEAMNKLFYRGGDLADRINLYKDLGYPAFTKASDWRILSDVSVFRGENGEKLDKPSNQTAALFKDRFQGGLYSAAPERKGYIEVLDKVRARILKEMDAPAQPKDKAISFNIWSDRITKDIFIGKKAVNGVVRLKTGFTNPKDARQYLEDNQAALEEQWNGLKKPVDYRRQVNLPRQGPTRREGDATPELFQDAFGFRGVQFGNWVEGDRRQVDINEAFDAFMDLADALGIPPKAVSLDGSLGLAFGARGIPNAAAHYEPGEVVINLSKKAGPGSLGHEWFHAFDNYFARLDRTGETKAQPLDRFASQFSGTPKFMRPEVWEAFKRIRLTLESGPFAERSKELDAVKSKPYYSQIIEKAARAFERYTVDRLEGMEISNDFLVNISKDNSPALPTQAEMDNGIRQAFDNLFNILDTKETDKGTALFSSASPTPESQRHAALEAKHNAGTITPAETKEAAKIVEARANKAGYNRKAYHGTWRAGFTKFNELTHFSPDKTYADRYQSTSASSMGISGIKEAAKQSTYEVFLKMQKPFDTRQSKARKLFNDEFLGKWGNGTPIQDRGLPDWTDSLDLAEWLNEQHPGEFDSFILDEGAEPTETGKIAVRPESFVPLDPRNIKSAEPFTGVPLDERFNPDSDSILYSSSSPARRSDPILDRIKAMVADPDKKAETYVRAARYVSDVRNRFDNARLKREFSAQGIDSARYTMIRDVAILEAIVKALPKEMRGKFVGKFRNVAEMKTEKGRERYMLAMLPKVEKALEAHLQTLYRQDIRKMMKRGAPITGENRSTSGKITPEGHDVFNQARQAMTMTAIGAEAEANELRAKLESSDEMEFDEIDSLDAQINALDLFYDYENADSARLAKGLEFLQGIYSEGRQEWLWTLKERKDQRAARVNAIIKGLNADGSRAPRTEGIRADEGVLKRIDEGIMGIGLSGSQTIRRLGEATKSKTVQTILEATEMAFARAEGQEAEMNLADNEELSKAMRDILKVDSDFALTTKLKELSTNEEGAIPVTTLEGRSYSEIKVPVGEVEAIINREQGGYVPPGGKTAIILTDAQRFELEKKWEVYNELTDEQKKGIRSLDVRVMEATGDRKSLGPMTQLEGLNLYLTMRQADQFEKLEAMGYDDNTMAELEAWLKPEAKALGKWMVDFLAADTPAVDKLHREERGVGLKLVDQYFPIRNDIAKADAMEITLDGASQMQGGRSVGFVKDRITNTAEPLPINALAVFLAHRAQVNFWKAHVTPLREYGGMLKDPRLAMAIKKSMGDRYYNALTRRIQRIEGGGKLKGGGITSMDRFVKAILRRFSIGTLGWRLSTFMVNLTAALNAGLAIPAPQLVKGMARAMKRPEAFKDAWNSPVIQRRLKTGATFEAMLAKQKGPSIKPISHALERMAEPGVNLINVVDTGANLFGAAAVWEYTRTEAVKAGMPDTEARALADEAAERLFLRAAQPTMKLARSEMELNALENPLSALFTLFLSEPRKNMALTYMAWREIATGKGTQGKAMAWQTAAVSLAYLAAEEAVRNFYRAFAKAEDDDEEEIFARFYDSLSNPKQWANIMATNHLRGIPFVGSAWASTMATAVNTLPDEFGEDVKNFRNNGNLLEQTLTKAFTGASRLVNDEGELDPDAAIDLTQAMGILVPGGPLFSQLANIGETGKDIYGTNYSEQGKVDRAKGRFNAYRRTLPKVTDENGKIDRLAQMQRDMATVDYIRRERAKLPPEQRAAFMEAIDGSLNNSVRVWLME
jgi:hypothetical protein